ncbi:MULTISPECIES: hypothetical protein [Streptomycetaceae]|uniref:hypothetical protein n=1 Tax=Streptomycetaceae TaxID=2062 RepID=UPI00093E7913|nr:hypothetical protein [Streptomyces sp. CB02056]OKI05570.1 hypothetical protein AMK13_19625 [Streptomyces sp. CB02056]
MHPTGPIARRFPLVARHRPACLPLTARVGRLTELADTASRQDDPSLASAVFNQAALLASDLALPGYARELCHRHAALHLTRGPLPATSAIHFLEPVVNLARLHIRAGHHQHGHQLLLDLYRAVTTATETTLDGITIPTRLTQTTEQQREVRRWLWRVLIADDTRALTTAGRWTDALRHIEQHRGIGRRILDGRQVAVLAHATASDLPGALALLADTEPGAPWENAVTAVLTALCHPGDRPAAETAIDHCLALEPDEGLAVFTTRLALTAIDAAGPDTPASRDLIEQLSHRAGETGDGYALRDLLAHPGVRDRLGTGRTAELAQALAACALGSATLPEPLRDQLEAALADARAVLEASPPDPVPPAGNPFGHHIPRTAHS